MHVTLEVNGREFDAALRFAKAIDPKRGECVAVLSPSDATAKLSVFSGTKTMRTSVEVASRTVQIAGDISGGRCEVEINVDAALAAIRSNKRAKDTLRLTILRQERPRAYFVRIEVEDVRETLQARIARESHEHYGPIETNEAAHRTTLDAQTFAGVFDYVRAAQQQPHDRWKELAFGGVAFANGGNPDAVGTATLGLAACDGERAHLASLPALASTVVPARAVDGLALDAVRRMLRLHGDFGHAIELSFGDYSAKFRMRGGTVAACVETTDRVRFGLHSLNDQLERLSRIVVRGRACVETKPLRAALKHAVEAVVLDAADGLVVVHCSDGYSTATVRSAESSGARGSVLLPYDAKALHDAVAHGGEVTELWYDADSSLASGPLSVQAVDGDLRYTAHIARLGRVPQVDSLPPHILEHATRENSRSANRR